MDERIGFGIYQSCVNRGLGCGSVWCVSGECAGGLGQGLEGWCYVCVTCESRLFV